MVLGNPEVSFCSKPLLTVDTVYSALEPELFQATALPQFEPSQIFFCFVHIKRSGGRERKEYPGTHHLEALDRRKMIIPRERRKRPESRIPAG